MQDNIHKSNGVTQLIGSPIAGLLFLGLALYAQTPHTQNAFLELGHEETNFAIRNSWAYAIALELAVLYFVVRGNYQASYIFAGVSVAMNVAYYTIHGNNMAHVATNWPRWLISISLPVAIAYYSHCIAGGGGVDVRAWALHRWQWTQSKVAWLRNLRKVQPVQEPEPLPVQVEQPALPIDAQPDLSAQIANLRLNGFSDQEIAAEHLRHIPGARLASPLDVDASTISRWRNPAKKNGHKLQEGA